MHEAMARDLGRYASFAQHALGVLELGSGSYRAAITASREAAHSPALSIATLSLPNLVEAAVRSDDRDLAAFSVEQLAGTAEPSGTDWGLGVLARSRALLAVGDDADRLYRAAVDHLGRCRAVTDLARAHLVYGEWLRRERRRVDAREQLRTAHEMFGAMGAGAFAERARVELTATGEHVPRPAREDDPVLTPQEARVAELVATGASNPEIAAQMFISRRTVEYHLHKMFRKLEVGSRTELARAYLDAAGSLTPDD
jgi:DNA-binding CsgD family transcriptional regulator